jgi:glycosyltransferase involved in cell wall biosynthesis
LSERSPRFLFVPVSGEFGKGEYARSLAIAQGAVERWPNAGVLFILSRAAPYAASTPLPTALLDSSPTFHTPEVVDIIEDWHPDVVIFDNAGRTAQLRAAKRAGARVVYISSRRRQRSKAFRWRWMSLIDEHWIAYPRFIAGGFTPLERLKLRFMRRPAVRYLDVILARPRPAGDSARNVGDFARTAGDAAFPSVVSRLGCEAGRYVLVVPGGGTGHPGAQDAVDQFLEAARAIAATGVDTVFVGRAPAGAGVAGAPVADAAVTSASSRLRGLGSLPAGAAVAPDASRLSLLESLPQSELGELMRGAKLIVANGGSTLLQAIACGRPCIAAPIAGDQAERIRRCVSAGVAVAVPLDAAAIATAITALLQDEPRANAFAGRAVALRLDDGVEVALRAMAALVESSECPVP